MSKFFSRKRNVRAVQEGLSLSHTHTHAWHMLKMYIKSDKIIHRNHVYQLIINSRINKG